MTSLINASTSTGVVVTPDTSGSLAFQSNGTSIATISSSGLTMNSGNIVQSASAAPAFSAYLSSPQSISSGTSTTIAFDTKSFDTASCYNTSTYRFTPNVAGYYSFSVIVQFASAISSGEYQYELDKNGSRAATLFDYTGSSLAYGASSSMLVYANGTTDYFTVVVYQSCGSSKNLNSGATGTLFQAFLARSA